MAKKELATVNENSAAVVPATQNTGNLSVFSDAKSFEVALRMADCLSKSTVVPREYQGNNGNCMIAIEMASRINTSPMMVMQNLYIVNGRPAWSAQWIISMINSSRRYKTELQFDFGHDKDDGGLSCTAWAEDWNGHKVLGPKITMNMANAEGWTNKNGSKWKTMPEVMCQKLKESAIQEFAKRLKDDWFRQGLESPDVDFDDYIDNLVKEMTESEEKDNA